MAETPKKLLTIARPAKPWSRMTEAEKRAFAREVARARRAAGGGRTTG